MPDAAASRITDIFIQVLQAEPARRPALIRELCGGDQHLTRDITELVAAAERAPSTGRHDARRCSRPRCAACCRQGRRFAATPSSASWRRGGMGVVYLARDIGLNMQVAIKALKPSIAGDAEHRRRLKHEAQLMAQLAGHPNIATVHALIDEGDALYIVEECLPGPTLREHLADGPLPVSGRESASGSPCCARSAPRTGERIVHRDLKPENVMRTSTGSWKVLDFGIAKLAGARPADDAACDTGADQRVGTPQYMSPEQLRGEPLDGRSDLFAFGILLYELLTGGTRSRSLAIPVPWPRGRRCSTSRRCHSRQRSSRAFRQGCPRSSRGAWKRIRRGAGRRPRTLEAALEAIDRGRMPAVMTAPAGERRVLVAVPRGLAAVVYWLTLIPMWHVRPWIGRSEWHVGGLTLVLDVRTLFLVLIATVAVLSVLRFSFVFVSRNKPSRIHEHHARAMRWVKAGDVDLRGGARRRPGSRSRQSIRAGRCCWCQSASAAS